MTSRANESIAAEKKIRKITETMHQVLKTIAAIMPVRRFNVHESCQTTVSSTRIVFVCADRWTSLFLEVATYFPNYCVLYERSFVNQDPLDLS